MTPRARASKMKMMIDQGNLLGVGVAISEDTFRRMDLRYETISQSNVGTAGKGLGMTRLGRTRPFTIRIDGIKKAFQTKATVIRDLADEVNLGGGFLQQAAARGIKTRLEFLPNGTLLHMNRETVDLVNKMRPIDEEPPIQQEKDPTGINLEPEDKGPPIQQEKDPTGNTMEPDRCSRRSSPTTREKGRETSCGGRKPNVWPVHASQTYLLPANSLCFVGTKDLPIRALVEPNQGQPGLCQALPAVYSPTSRIAMLNLGPKFLLKKDTQIGEAIPLSLSKTPVNQERVSTLGREEIKEQLLQDLGLDANPILQKDPVLLQHVKELIGEYQDVFASPEQEIGKTSLIEFNVTLKPGARPVKQKVRPLNPHQKEDLRKQLDLWEREEVIEETESPWASALVPALKKGGAIRWAVDYRALNAMTVADAYPLPNIQDNLDKLQGSKIFSTLDAASAYHTIPVEARSRPLLAFTTPWGLYTFRRMPFGACNAGSTYSRFVEILVQKLRSPYILSYLDDVIVHTSTTQHHLEELRSTLQIHREGGIRLRPQKTHLFQSEADYLGFRVTKDGIKMRDDYVEKITNWPVPKTPKELGSFLGFCGYYRTFIKDYSRLTGEMDGQKRKKTLDWTEEMDNNFKTLKELFNRRPIRAYPEFHEGAAPFEVRPDFCGKNVGAVLEQVQDGQLRFIAAIGRKTTQGESNYPPTKGELCGIIYALRKWEHILRFKPFLLFTDHQALKWLHTMKSPKGLYWRWIAELATYQYKLGWRPGKEMGCADGLSRSSHMDEPTPEEEAESEEFIGNIHNIHTLQMDMEKIRLAQEEDPILKEVRKWIASPPPKEELKGHQEDYHTYHQHLGSLYIDEGGVLMMKHRGGKPVDEQPDRIAIPNREDLHHQVFYWSHSHPSAGHFGSHATTMRASLKFYWPGMISYLRRRVKTCDACLAKQQKVDNHQTEHQPKRHGYPGEILYVDLVGPLPESRKGDKYVLTMQDGFSKFACAHPIPCKEAEVVANQLIESWLTKFGCPGSLHSDQGREFENRIWQALCDRLEIHKTHTPSYNPSSNLVERFHRTLNQILRIYMTREEKSWDRYVDTAAFAYNTKINESTSTTPFEAFMGRPAKLPIDLVLPTPQQRYENEAAYVQDTMHRFERMYEHMRRHTEARFRRNARGYTGNLEDYKPGDLVWCFTQRKIPGKPGKITDSWIGPYEVLEQLSAVLLSLKPAATAGKAIVVHRTRVRRYQGSREDDKYRPPDEPPGDDQGDELAEELGQPARWIEPPDNLQIPIQVPKETPPMEDIRREPEAPVKEKVTIPEEAHLEQQEKKRERGNELETGNPSKRGRRRNRWQDLAETSSSETEEMHHLGEMLQVTMAPGAAIPTKGSEGSAGWDMRADQSVTLHPGRTTKVSLGLRLATPPGHTMLLLSRSRLASEGITTQGGVIDSDYRGVVQCLLHNSTSTPRRITKGERVCQGVFLATPQVEWVRGQLEATQRNEGGFGSSGT